MRKRILQLGAVAAFAALAVFLLRKTPPPPPAAPGTGDVGKNLAARVAERPRPSLAHLPQLTQPADDAAAAAVTNAPANPAASARLSEDALLPLRRAFKPPRFAEDPAVPRERQTLLSNRRLVSPEARSIPKSASGRQTPTPRGTTPFIVQFNVPVSDDARRLLTDAGATVRGFFPNNAVLAELAPDALAALENVPQVQAADEFLPSDKIQPFLASLIAAHPGGTQVRATLQTFAPEDAATVAAAVRKAGGDVEEAAAGERWGIVRAVLPLGAVRGLAGLGAVQWIEERPEARLRNDKAALPAHLNATNAWAAWGLTGRGQVIGHADTGLDTGKPATLHPDFQGRVRAIIARGRSGDASDPSGHGTHTAGSILGSGAASGGLYRGIAWEAELIHQSVMNATGHLTGLPSDLGALYTQCYTNGAFIHSDSWGSSTYGGYDTDCRLTDLFAWNHPGHLAVFSAGNDGTDRDADGVVDPGSVGSPAAAKNALAVGAAESDRAPGSGGYSSLTWYLAWPADFPAAPIRNDTLSWSATPTPVYRQGMAAFSSRGPAADGRVKPDVTAPGTDVISTKSSVGGNGWGILSGNSRYCFNGGTSMAAPLAAGTAALLRQYCVERAGIPDPTAALLKAMLCGGARSLAPGQYGTGPAQEIPSATPNNVEGWGQPDAAAAVHPEGRMIRLLDRIGPAAGATNTFDVTVTVPGAPLDIALCWLDYPATAGASPTRVNDLDLLVTAPDGTALFPNGGAARDTLNTVETVRVPSAQTGLWRVRVIGASVPYPGGAAALYLRGAFDAPPVIVHTPPPSTQTASPAAHGIDFQIQSLAPLTNGEVRIWWRSEVGDQRSEVGGQKSEVGDQKSEVGDQRSAVSAPASDLRSPTSDLRPLTADLRPPTSDLRSPTSDLRSPASDPPTSWHTAAALWLAAAKYRAEIPPVPPATTVRYYIETAHGTNPPVLLPPGAPAAAFSFYIDNATELTVEGSPARFGTVVPPYGTGTQIANTPFTASAPAAVSVSADVRRACAGWLGTGDIPATGATHSATLSISQPSTLTWLWNQEFALTPRYRFADTGQYFGSPSPSWWPQGAPAATPAAPAIGLSGSVPYAFCGWSVDGARWPDTASAAPNPATGIPMHAPRSAVADYLPYWLDSDHNGISDWWELRYFGSPTNPLLSPDADPDADGWSNYAEFLDNTDPRDPASRPLPPVITHAPLAPFQSARPPWPVTATVTDNTAVEEVLLLWRESGETGWRSAPMQQTAPGTFRADLAPPSHGAKRIDYRIHAADILGAYFPQHAADTPVHSVIGDYPDPWLRVTPPSLPLLELSAAATNLALTVANLAGPDLVWTARVAACSAPFPASDPAWAHRGTNDPWCVTTNRTWNGDPVWYCGNPATRAYPNGCHAALDTPPFTVRPGGGLLFRQWIKTEHDTGPHYWDGALIRLSSDGGATFSTASPASGYPGLITGNPDSPFPPAQPCLSGDGTRWETLLLDLSAHAGQTLIVRFEFGSDLYVTDEGWYIAAVSPFSPGDPLPPWLAPSGPWGGTLPDTWAAPLAASLLPSALAPGDEAAAVLRIDSNDPAPAPLLPLTLRRGHLLHLTANGPGTASADRTFLFRASPATATLQADPGSHLYALLLNGIPLPGIYDTSAATRTVTFTNVTEDQHLSAWFTPKLWTLTIATPHSTAIPPAGTHPHPNGTPVTATVINPLPLTDRTRLQCTGWQLTGHTPSSGPSPLLTFTLTNHATLTWQWTNAHLLTASSGPGGAASPATGWYPAGSTASVTAHPSAYHHFTAWSGDLSGALPDGPLLTAPMNAPRSVTASFAPNLTALRGVPEWWLAQYGWTHDFEAAAESDTDADGMAAWAEWHADTDPTDPLSRLAVTAFTPANIVWIGGQNRTQILERAATLSGPWHGFHTNLPPTPVTNSLPLPAPDTPSRFFRITVP